MHNYLHNGRYTTLGQKYGTGEQDVCEWNKT